MSFCTRYSAEENKIARKYFSYLAWNVNISRYHFQAKENALLKESAEWGRQTSTIVAPF